MAKTGSKLRARGRLWRAGRAKQPDSHVDGAQAGAELGADVLDALLSSMQSGLLIEDASGRIRRINTVLLRDLRLDGTPEDVASAGMRDVDQAFRAYAVDADEVLGRAEQLREAAVAARGEIIHFADGRVLERDYAPLERDGQITGHLWHYRDVTERVDEARELERQNENLKQLDRTKDEFVALVSHELRTPLTSILGYLEIGFPERDELPDIQREALDTVGRNADRLLRLVNDLLFVAQLDAGRLSIQPGTLDLAAIVSESVEGQRARAEAKGVAVLADTSMPCRISGDTERLAQLVDNLVSNAIKFTPSGGAVTVRLRNQLDDVVLEVRDTGIGIDAAEQNRLFERFFRATSATTRKIPGTGLGLAIVRAIIDAHAGSVEVTSEEGVGSTFRVTLPAISDDGSTFQVPEWEESDSVEQRLDGIVKGAGR